MISNLVQRVMAKDSACLRNKKTQQIPAFYGHNKFSVKVPHPEQGYSFLLSHFFYKCSCKVLESMNHYSGKTNLHCIKKIL